MVCANWCLSVALLLLFIVSIAFSEEINSHIRDLSKLRRFVEDNGGYIYKYLEPKETPGAGWSVYFSDATPSDAPFEPDDGELLTIARVPRSVMICNTSAKDSNLLGRVISLWMTNRTFYDPYFQSLPTEMDLLWHWSDEELSYIDNPILVSEAVERRRDRIQFYESLVRSFPFEISFLEFKLADFWVDSRAFGVDNDICLVPFADVPNHDQDTAFTSWGWGRIPETGEPCFLMLSKVLPRPGKEFTIAYKEDLTNELTLVEYGFVNIDSKLQRADLDIPAQLMPDDSKAKLLPKIVLGHDPDTFWLFYLFRTFVANVEELDAYSKHIAATGLDRFHDLFSSRRDADAMKACSQVIRAGHPQGHLLRKEFEYLYSKSLSYRRRMALAYRISYDRLFERAAENCERLEAFVQCSTERRLRRIWKRYQMFEPTEFKTLKKGLYFGGRDALCR